MRALLQRTLTDRGRKLPVADPHPGRGRLSSPCARLVPEFVGGSPWSCRLSHGAEGGALPNFADQYHFPAALKRFFRRTGFSRTRSRCDARARMALQAKALRRVRTARSRRALFFCAPSHGRQPHYVGHRGRPRCRWKPRARSCNDGRVRRNAKGRSSLRPIYRRCFP